MQQNVSWGSFVEMDYHIQASFAENELSNGFHDVISTMQRNELQGSFAENDLSGGYS
jgi:hypothetical protein